jgi:hypothetical protein
LYQTEADLSDPPVLQARPAEAESQVVVDPASPASEAVGDLPRISLAPLTPPIVADPTLEGGTDALFPAVKSPPDAARPDAAAVSPEDRIKRLEDRFDAILAELRELKNPGQSKFKSAVKNSDPTSSTPTVKRKLFATAQAKPVSETTLDPASSGPEKPGYAKKPPRAEGEPEAVTLTRTTYKLPPGRAQAVAAFFAQNLNDEIEVRVKGETLQVTATKIPAGGSVRVVRGVVDYAGSGAPRPNTAVVKSFAPSDFVSGKASMNVDTSSSCFVRTQVVNSAGAVVAVSNPVWLLRSTPPNGIPTARRVA